MFDVRSNNKIESHTINVFVLVKNKRYSKLRHVITIEQPFLCVCIVVVGAVSCKVSGFILCYCRAGAAGFGLGCDNDTIFRPVDGLTSTCGADLGGGGFGLWCGLSFNFRAWAAACAAA